MNQLLGDKVKFTLLGMKIEMNLGSTGCSTHQLLRAMPLVEKSLIHLARGLIVQGLDRGGEIADRL
jgi:hypothetical protein